MYGPLQPVHNPFSPAAAALTGAVAALALTGVVAWQLSVRARDERLRRFTVTPGQQDGLHTALLAYDHAGELLTLHEFVALSSQTQDDVVARAWSWAARLAR